LWDRTGQINFYEQRVSEEELDKLKQAARLESYVSYSELLRRTALKKKDRVVKKPKRRLIFLRKKENKKALKQGEL
jgi:hypothetical protein